MTKSRKLEITFRILSVVLLFSLLVKITKLPGGIILPGCILGAIMLLGIIIGCLILTAIFRIFSKRFSFLNILSVTTTIAFSAFHYQLYSPTLHIVVPNGYTGEVKLLLSNVNDNILTIDTNGIGYLNEWTFRKTYTKPVVKQFDGKNLEKNLVGFNPLTFWAIGYSIDSSGKASRCLSFKIVDIPQDPTNAALQKNDD
ncbi:MAG: hypothetical protein KF744_06545 [Taibaiella sp.]|nr:hypothetical protein [Taibaiella sp.]